MDGYTDFEQAFVNTRPTRTVTVREEAAAIFGEVAHQARDLWDAGRQQGAFRCLQETGLSEQQALALGFMLWQITTGQRPASGS